ncbi:polysaccharide pyruvyl transferase family protein [Methylobacterium brachiatum]|uniref:Polysaccharide pyruvyl transferase family protein n=1 Tax=Methylobacterium brachiatum TaxID=269660 RepID=A0ABV1R6S0_9HYPH
MIMIDKLLIINAGGAFSAKTAYYELPFDPRSSFSNFKDVNTGDTLVLDATLRALPANQVRSIQFGEDLDGLLETWGQPDIAVVRGSNYFHEHFDLGDFVKPLESLKCAIVALGVGAQASSYGPIELPRGSIKFLHFLSDRSTSLGVRGAFSAEIFAGHGVKNVDIIGCPSFFRSGNPKLQIKKVQMDGPPKIGFNFNRFLGSYYCSNFIKTFLLQADLMQCALGMAHSKIYWQGEKEELFISKNDDDHSRDLLKLVLKRYRISPDPVNAQRFKDRLRCFLNVEEWATHVRFNCDAMLGFRLHGNVIALHQGIPAVMFSYDTRTRELIDYFSLPYVEIERFPKIDVAEFIKNADFTLFERAYMANFATFRHFLFKNGLSTQFSKASVPAGGSNSQPIGLVDEDHYRQAFDKVSSMYNDLINHR